MNRKYGLRCGPIPFSSENEKPGVIAREITIYVGRVSAIERIVENFLLVHGTGESSGAREGCI